MEDTFEYQLAAVAIVKDEAPYIKEWLDYHMGAGIEHFYIYDNESSDNLREVLQPYIESGHLDYEYYPGKYCQFQAYNDALRQHKFDAKYMAFFDIDEFILPLQQERILDIIEDIMGKSSHVGGLSINCKSFGSSGHKEKPRTGGVLENYLHRAPDGYAWSDLPWKWDAHVKTIVNPRKVLDYATAHNPKYFLEFYSADEKGRRVEGIDNFVEDVTRIRVNHYFTKSQAEWLAKRNKGKADYPGLRPLEEFSWRDRNDVYDDSILKYRDLCHELHFEKPEPKEHIPLLQRFAGLYKQMIQHPDPGDWCHQLGNLLQLWGICQRELRKRQGWDWHLELYEDLIFAAMVKSLQSNVFDTLSIELAASLWQDLCKESGAMSQQFRKHYMEALGKVVSYFRISKNSALERYFSEKIQDLCLQSLTVSHLHS